MDTSLRRSLQFLREHQTADGSFVSFSSATLAPHHPQTAYTTVFQNALILDCLCSVPPSQETKIITARLATFLLKQRSAHGSFNYWARDTAEATRLPYPDDLDDTACAWAALYHYDQSLLDGTVLAQIVTVLTAVESAEGGPYHTWVVPKPAREKWGGVDLAVNSNVAYFLSLQDVSLPNVTALIEAAITSGKYTSAYYPTIYPLIYFISRWYRGPLQDQIIRALQTAQHDHYWENPLDTALAVSSLLRLGVPPGELTESLAYLRDIAARAAWPAVSFCLDPAQAGSTHYAGSAALTAAFGVEALVLAEHIATAVPVSPLIPSVLADTVYQALAQHTEERFKQLGVAVQPHVRSVLHKALAYDRAHQLALTPYLFIRALKVSPTRLDTALVTRAALVSFYGWLAYTLFDDILDGESKPEDVPMATLALREVTQLVATLLPDEPQFTQTASQFLDHMERAAAWEVLHCRTLTPLRIPDYGDCTVLAQRSLGHSLASLAVLQAHGFGVDTLVGQQVVQFFHHFIIARQLQDDLHDWEEDLQRGQINAVSAQLLRAYQTEHGESVSLPPLDDARKFFWYKVVAEIETVVLDHLRRAKECIAAVPQFTEPAFILSLLEPIRRGAEQTQQEREQTLAFLKSYAQSH